MMVDGSEETPFAQELAVLTKKAVDLHYEMSGKPTPPDEKFIRDWIAVKLFKSQRRQIMMEVIPYSCGLSRLGCGGCSKRSTNFRRRPN
jgi:hypothetical protein